MSIIKTILEKRKKLKGEDPCWDNYKMVGLKANGDPNCVGPVKENHFMNQPEMVTINSPGHHLHNKPAHVFFKHDDGRVNVQVRHSAKKGHVTNLSLKPSQFVKGVVNLDKQEKEKNKSMKEELQQVTELKTSTLQSYLQKRNNTKARASSAASTFFEPKDSPKVKAHAKKEAGIERAQKKLAPHYAAQAADRAKKQKEELKKNNPPHEVAKKMAAVKKEYEQSHGPIEKSGHQYAEGNGYYHGKELHQRYHALKALHKTVSEEVKDSCGVCGQTPCNCTHVVEATSAAVRMQRALQKAKEERERRERLAKPFVDKVFGKKEDNMKKLSSIREEAQQKVHPDALHVKPVKVNGQTKYHVHAVGKNFSDGIKVGEHLSDSELDDFSEMGGKIKHVK